MARKISAADPALAIEFWISGYYTRRSQLFAPFKNIGINVVSFRDPVLAGSDMEDTDLYEWQRRPGFSIFCSQQLPDAEVVNQFYSFRNLDGDVVPMYDSTVQLAQFSSTTITSIITKTTTDQGFVAPVGNLLYFSDGAGADLQKWDSVEPLSAINPSSWGLTAPTVTPSLTALGCWLPKTTFATDSAILDPNGSVEVAFISAAATVADIATYTTESTIDIPGAYNEGAWYVNQHPIPGQNFWNQTTPAGQYSNYITFQGFGFSVPAGSTIVGVQVIIGKQAVSNNPASYETDYSVKLTVAGAVSGTEHASATHWPQTQGGAPTADGWQYASYGGAADTWGVALTPAVANAAGFGIALAAQAPGAQGDYPFVNGSPYPATITIYYQLPSGGGAVGISGLNEPTWSTILNSPTQDGTISWTNVGPLLIWYPGTNYPTPAVVVDTNGNLELVTQATVPIEAWDSGTAYAVGDEVAFGGVYWVAVADSTGVAPAALYTVVTGSTTQPYWIQVPNPITTGLTAPAWSTTQGGTTVDGDYTWTNIGQGNLIEAYGTSYVFGYRTIYGHLTTCSPISISTGSIFGPQSVGITAFSITDNVVTFTGTNNFIPGNIFTVYGFTTGIYLNGQPFTVLAAGLSTTSFSANFTYPDTGSTNDTASTQPLIATVTGVGTGSVLCNATATITAIGVSADVVTISAVNSFTPGLYVTFTGITTATWLNNQQLQIINTDPNGQWFQVYAVQPNQPVTVDTGTVTFNAVEIYRVSDGGGIYLFAGAVTNPGTGLNWTYDDFTTDADLNILQIAPQNHQNDPPPGAPGSTIPTAGTVTVYWQGRLWMIVGNYVYFNAGPDCTNGIPEESWPPGNRFQFAGPPQNLIPSADGVALIVCLADRYNLILGGPDTISFYPTDALDNFGISNPNAVFKDGSTIGQFTTQKQYIELIGNQKQETSEHIADYIAANFSASSAYATFHRDGEDVGVFISNGTDQILRFGSNISAWSVPAYPIMGAGALRSIETSVGITSLMLASPTGGVSGSVGPLNPTSCVSAGSGTAWVNPENITAGNPTSYAVLTVSAASSGSVPLDTQTSGVGENATTLALSLTTSATNEWAVCAFQTPNGSVVAAVGWTQSMSLGASQFVYTQFVSSARTVLSNPATFASGEYSGVMALFYTNGVAPTIIQTKAGTPAANTQMFAVSFNNNVTAGSGIIVMGLGNQGSGIAPPPIQSISDSQGNNYTFIAQAINSGSPSGNSSIWYAPNAAGGACTVTVTYTTTITLAVTNVFMMEVSPYLIFPSLQNIQALSYQFTAVPANAVVSGVEVLITGKTNVAANPMNVTPSNPVAGATVYPLTLTTSNTTTTLGSPTDRWNMPAWISPVAIKEATFGFELIPKPTGNVIYSISEVQVKVYYQGPGNYLYARDINSWGDGGAYGANNGTPYSDCEITVGSITLSQLGGRMFPLQFISGYFDAVGTLNDGAPSQPNLWILPNEISDTAGIGFIQLPEILQEPPVGQNHPSESILALRYPVNMMNSSLASQFIHHLQVKISFSPELAPNTIKALAFSEDQST